jgi:hypothetical protein
VGVYLVYSTTYGAASPLGRKLKLDRIKPAGLFGRLARAADVTVAGDSTLQIGTDAAVLYGEVPAEEPSRSWADWAAARGAFLGYVGECYRLLDQSAGIPLSEYLGWAESLKRSRRDLIELQQGSNKVLRAIATSQQRTYGVTLH